jgi:dinuclear metal center YbgI/SA1388 family protein
MASAVEITQYINDFLAIDTFKDYAPNGLQVEGKADINKIVTGVTANMALIEAAVEAQADMIIVHHGYFWPNEDQRIIGMKKRRIQCLLKNDINLLGYHLPLDAHAELGNNAQLAKKLGIHIDGLAGKGDLMAYGSFDDAMTAEALAGLIDQQLDRAPLLVGPLNKSIKKIAWCTGAAQSYIQHAIDIGADAFISGEISEQTTHIANESGIVYVSAGHHATERYGVMALGEHLAEKFQIAHQFIDIANPV